jgi:virginiamycin B lyase
MQPSGFGQTHPKVVQPGPGNGRWLVFPEPGGQTNLYPFQVTVGPDRNIWFTVQEYSGGGQIGFVTNSGAITQFQIPVTAYPWDITSAPDSKLWFADTRNNVIGSCTLGGLITTYSAQANGGITSGPQGDVWFSGGPGIGRISDDGKIKYFTLPVHVYELTPGPDGNIWFTVGTITQDSRTIVQGQTVTIGKMTTTGAYTLYTIPNASGEGIGITAGHDGNMWVLVENGPSPGLIVKVTLSGAMTEYTLPGDVQGVDNNRIISAPSGELWYTRNSANQTQYIGRITLTGKITEYLYQTTNQHLSFLGGLAVGPDGNVWFSQTNPVQDGMNVYLRLQLLVKPSSVTFPAIGHSREVRVFESDYASGWTASTSDDEVATVRPGPESNGFTITATGSGSATITISDERGNYFPVTVTVP